MTLVSNAQARRVVFDGSRAVGVEYGADGRSATAAQARREVILCGGAVGSPQLLMLSGVGPRDHLEEHGIDVVADRAEVGANLQDHVACPVIYHCPEKITLVGAESPIQLLKFLLIKRGMLTSCVGEAAAFIRTRAEIPGPDIEILFAPVPYLDHGLEEPPGHGITVGPILLQPESRGSIRLASADPLAAPVIDPRYLSDRDGDDLRALIAGVRKAMEIASAAPMAPYVAEPMRPSPRPDDDDAMTRYVREQAFGFYHPVGTCRMGSDAGAVVDPELRVNGVEALRVVDASIMPRINRGHTQAPTFMLAERAAQMILEARSANHSRSSKKQNRADAAAEHPPEKRQDRGGVLGSARDNV